MARHPAEPAKSGPGGAARWIGYLDWVRGDVVRQVLALDEKERRTSRLPSGWTPIELLSHLLHMEQRWFVWGFLGEQVEQPWGDWNIPEPWRSDETLPAARWTVSSGVTAEHLAERLERVAARTRAVLTEHPLDAVAAPGGRFSDDPPTLEWICFHVLVEYARHAGQLDVAVELAETPPPTPRPPTPSPPTP